MRLDLRPLDWLFKKAGPTARRGRRPLGELSRTFNYIVRVTRWR